MNKSRLANLKTDECFICSSCDKELQSMDEDHLCISEDNPTDWRGLFPGYNGIRADIPTGELDSNGLPIWRQEVYNDIVDRETTNEASRVGHSVNESTEFTEMMRSVRENIGNWPLLTWGNNSGS